MSPWTIVAIVAGVILVLFWHGRNAIRGGATIGVIVGIILSLVKHDWWFMIPSFAIGTFSGLASQALGDFGDWLKRRRYRQS